MNYQGKLLDRIRHDQEALSKSERKVAAAVLVDPETAIRTSIAKLAEIAGVSEPTVNRFCRNLDCSGWSDFKLRIAQELATESPYISRKVSAEDELDVYAGKIFEATMASIAQAWAAVEPVTLERAVNALAQARKIEFYGLGITGPTALDAQHKFFYLNVPVAAYTDVLMQRMAANATHAGDVVVVFSCSDSDAVILAAAKNARRAGATVIGITAVGTILAESCHIVLSVEPSDISDIYAPITSRIVYLALIDILAMGVILKRGQEFKPHLQKVREGLSGTDL